MVPKGGLEPPRVAPHAPQTCASASSATSAPAESKYAVDAIALSIDRGRAARGSAADANDPPDARLAQARIERVADALAEEIVREHGDEDRESRVHRHPPRDLDRVLAVVQDVAPCRVGGLDAQTEEGQAGLRQDRRGNAKRHR